MPQSAAAARRIPTPTSGGFTPKQIIPALMTGLIGAILVIIFGISFSGLIFTGPLASHASVGVGLALLGTLILSVVIPLFSTYPGTIGGLASLPAIGIGVIATSLASSVRSDQLLPTVLVTIMVAGVFTGSAMYLFGVFDLGKVGQYVPYPVIGGFLAGLGVILVQRSFSFGLSADFSLARVAAFDSGGVRLLLSGQDWVGLSLVTAVGLAMWAAQRAKSSTLNIPLILAAAITIFWLAAWNGGHTAEGLRESGWLLAPFPEGGFWTPAQNIGALKNADWLALAREAPMFPVMFLLVLIPALTDASSLELVVKQDIDPNREIKSAGLGNIVCGLAGGFLGTSSLSATTMVAKAGLPFRMIGLVSATFCGIVFFFGAGAISYLPRFPIAGLLFYIGIDFMREWLYSSRRKVSKLDYATILTVFLVVSIFGFMQGFLVGLILGLIFFVFTYSKLPVVRYATTAARHFSNVERSRFDREYLRGVGERTVILKLQGYIFFGTARKLLDRVRERLAAQDLPPLNYLVLDFKHVDGLDTSAVINFQKLDQYAEASDFVVVLSNCSPELNNLLTRRGNGTTDSQRVETFPDLDRAVEWVEQRQISDRDAAGPLQAGDGRSFKALFPSEEVHAAILAYFEACTFSSGDYLVRQGEAADDIVFVEEGEVSVYLESEDGPPIRLRKYLSGSVVGEVAMVLGTHRTASVIADTAVSAYRLSRSAMERMRTERPEIGMVFEGILLRMMTMRLQDANNLIRELLD